MSSRRFLHPYGTEHVGKRVIPLVAGVLEQEVAAPLHRHHHGPRSGIDRWIVDGELIEQRLGVDAGKALDQVKVLVKPIAQVREIRRIDD